MPPSGDRFKALGLALLVHGFLFGLIALNWQWTSATRTPVNVIQARVITGKPLPTKPSAVDWERQKAQQREIANRKRAASQKKQEAARERAVARRKALATKRHQQAQEMMQQQLAAEEAERTTSNRMSVTQSKAAKYLDLIGLKVSSKWQRPPGSSRDAYCILRVRITPGGRVLSVNIVRSSGDPVFDRATENAIYLAEPLPVPAEADVFNLLREFNIDTQKL